MKKCCPFKEIKKLSNKMDYLTDKINSSPKKTSNNKRYTNNISTNPGTYETSGSPGTYETSGSPGTYETSGSSGTYETSILNQY